MVLVRPICNDDDLEGALIRIEEIFFADAGAPESDELDLLTDLVEFYESENVPIGYPNAVDAIEFRMDQAGFSPEDLIPIIGSRSRVSEVLSGRRSITMPMAEALSERLGISAEAIASRIR